MISQADFFGGCEARASMSADITLAPGSKRVQRLNPQFAGLATTLPDATLCAKGGPRFYLLNQGSDSVAVKDKGGSTVATLSTDKCLLVVLLDNLDANGEWLFKEFDI